MSNKDVSALIADFGEQSDRVSARLTELLGVVGEGRTPTPGAMAELNDSVSGMDKKYREIYALAKAVVPAEELPEQGSSVGALADAVKKSRSRYIAEQLKHAKEALRKFTGVETPVKEYAAALAPYRTEASGILEKLTEESAEKLLPAAKPADVFLRAMEIENIHSAEGIRLMKSIRKHFPEMEIQLGLAGKKYFYSSPAGKKEAGVTSSGEEAAAPENEPSEPVAKAKPAAAKSKAVAAKPKDAAAKPKDAAAKAKDAAAAKVEAAAPAEGAGKKGGAAESAGGAKPCKYPVTNKVKTAAPGASAFKNEIVRLCRTFGEVTAILPLFTNLGVLSREQIYDCGACMGFFSPYEEAKESVFAAIDVLVSKGFLARFQSAGGDELYCLSGYCRGCMKKESIVQMRSLWNVSFGRVEVSADTEIDEDTALSFYTSNTLLLQYLSAQKRRLPEREFEKIKLSIRWDGDHYKVAAIDRRNARTAYLSGSAVNFGELEEPYVIISEKFTGLPARFSPSCKKVFVVDGDRVIGCKPSEDIAARLAAAAAAEESAGTQIEEDAAGEAAETASGAAAAGEASAGSAAKGVESGSLKAAAAAGETGRDRQPGAKAAGKAGENAAERGTVESGEGNLSAQALLELGRVPSDAEFCALIHSLLGQGVTEETLKTAVVNAVLLAKGAGTAANCPKSKRLSLQLRLAANLLTDDCCYSSECLAEAFSGTEDESPALTLAAYMYALLTPAIAHDYGLKTQTDRYLSDFEIYFGNLLPFKALLNKLIGVKKVSPVGFTPAVISLLGSEDKSERFISNLRRRAADSLSAVTPKARMKALPLMYSNEFGTGSYLRECMEMISEGRTDKEALEWIKVILSGYCDDDKGSFCINEHKLGERLDKAWGNASSGGKFRLEFDARDQALRQYRQRIKIMQDWIEHIRSRSDGRQDIERLKLLKNELLELLADIGEDRTWREVGDANVLHWLLAHMTDYLNGTVSNVSIFSDLLYTGVFSLSVEGLPELDATLNDVRYYELWRNALRHIAAKKRTVDEITADILGRHIEDDGGSKDNLRQLYMLGVLTDSKDDIFVVTELQAKDAAASADIKSEVFRDRLELAYTYYQINETEKENLAGLMNRYKSSFYEIGDFACWRRFLAALEKQISEFAEGRKKGLRARLTARLEKDADSPLLLEAEKLLEEDSNFAVTEEYLNRYEAGERNLDDTVLFDKDYFGDFLNPPVFDPLLRECQRNKGRALKSFGWNYVEKHLPKEWTSRLHDDSKLLISSWPTRKDLASPPQVKALLRGLGIDAVKAEKVNGRREEMWQLSVRPAAKSLADYIHPIAAFGTQMKSPLQVIFLYGNYTAQQLVDTVTQMNLGVISIVFIDRPIDAADRRYIGEIFHTQKSGQNPFLFVDQVLLLYLAMHQETERLPALLKCTLPYTTYQPFVRDGGSTADEMFCGRKLELATIIDPNGACIVYGGRQLGKTALLERAESRCSKPENNAYAVYSTIVRQKDEAEVVETLVGDINNKTGGKIALKECGTLREMCSQLGGLFREGRIVSMHLLIDEVDDFLGAIAADAYKQIQPLVDLKRETKNNFKFVIAGLHNVCRAKNATIANGIFGQLGTPLCIKPLSPADALQLLSRPLRYLGFQIDKHRHLKTILTNTNYYPGILQFFGYILVETLTGQYSRYYRAVNGNPPFTLKDEQLGAVMNSSDLNKSIKDKFRWSLELDPRYFMIARCITLLYHLEDRTPGSWQGFPVDSVMGVAELYDIHCLAALSRAEYIVLMDEMVEMGILSKPDESADNYRLRRSSFVDIIGESPDSLEDDINDNNKEI